MVNTANSPFDPLDRMEPGEDRFVIREKDPAGPAGITGWAAARRLWAFKTYGFHAHGDAKRLLDAELAQCAEAEEKALAWSERMKGAEQIEEQRATYSGVQQTEEQIAAAKRQKEWAELVRHLREADYHIHELLAIDGPAAPAKLGEQAVLIHELSVGVTYGEGGGNG
jgi:hypothetical protein